MTIGVAIAKDPAKKVERKKRREKDCRVQAEAGTTRPLSQAKRSLTAPPPSSLALVPYPTDRRPRRGVTFRHRLAAREQKKGHASLLRNRRST